MGFPLGQVGRSLSGALPEARGQTSCGSPEVNIRNRILYYRFLSASVSDSSLPPAMKVPPHKSRCCERETGFSTGNLVVGPSSPLHLPCGHQLSLLQCFPGVDVAPPSFSLCSVSNLLNLRKISLWYAGISPQAGWTCTNFPALGYLLRFAQARVLPSGLLPYCPSQQVGVEPGHGFPWILSPYRSFVYLLMNKCVRILSGSLV